MKVKNLPFLLTFSLVSIFILSCSTTSEAKWYYCGPSEQKAIWRICNKKYDKEELHHKGFCRKAKVCRKNWTGAITWKSDQRFCAFADEKCWTDNNIDDKILVSRK